MNLFRCITARNVLAAAGSAVTASMLIVGCANGPRWDASRAWGPERTGVQELASRITRFGSQDRFADSPASAPPPTDAEIRITGRLPRQHPTREGLSEDPFLSGGWYDERPTPAQTGASQSFTTQTIAQVEAARQTPAVRDAAPADEHAEVIPPPREDVDLLGPPQRETIVRDDAWMDFTPPATDASSRKRFEFPPREPAAEIVHTEPASTSAPEDGVRTAAPSQSAVNGFVDNFDEQFARLRIAMREADDRRAAPVSNQPLPQENPFEVREEPQATAAADREAEIRALIAAARERMEAGQRDEAYELTTRAEQLTAAAREAARAETVSPFSAAPAQGNPFERNPFEPGPPIADEPIARQEDEHNPLADLFGAPDQEVAASEPMEPEPEPQPAPEPRREPLPSPAKSEPTVAQSTVPWAVDQKIAETIPSPAEKRLAATPPVVERGPEQPPQEQPDSRQFARRPEINRTWRADELPVIVSRNDRPLPPVNVEYPPSHTIGRDPSRDNHRFRNEMVVSADDVPSRHEARALHQSGAAVYVNSAPATHRDWLQRDVRDSAPPFVPESPSPSDRESTSTSAPKGSAQPAAALSQPVSQAYTRTTPQSASPPQRRPVSATPLAIEDGSAQTQRSAALQTSRDVEPEPPPFSEPGVLDFDEAGRIPHASRSAVAGERRLSTSKPAGPLGTTELTALHAVDWESEPEPLPSSGLLPILRNPVLIGVALALLLLVGISCRRRWQVD